MDGLKTQLIMIIKDEFIKSVRQFKNSKGIAESLWHELEKDYSAPSRHYHTLDHLNDMLRQLGPFKGAFEDWHAIVFAIAYHDVVYKPWRSDNEEESASMVVQRLDEIGVPEACMRKCEQLILATKRHERADHETNLFTDADLSILGSDRNTYQRYAANVRLEYSMFPNVVYNAGRKKVLRHFLGMDAIFRTEEFFNILEAKARENLEWELAVI